MVLKQVLPYLEIFNTILTIILNLSPIVALMPVIKGKEKYTNVPVSMLIFNLLNNLCWACYWYRKSFFSPFLCSCICSIIATIFFNIYLYFFSNKRIQKYIIYLFSLIFLLILIIYVSMYIIKSLIFYGRYLIVINIIMYAAPGQNLLKVIKEKNYKLIPIASTIVGAICSGGWFLYGNIVNDINCIIPNVLGLIFSIFTTIIWLIFYINKKLEQKKAKFYEEQNKTRDVQIN